jgi:16S rRNA (cytidine1402-2'-O)-methyltransferase
MPLILLPNLIDPEQPLAEAFPPITQTWVQKLDGLIAESDKEARRFLRRFISHEAMQRVRLEALNEHTREIQPLLGPIQRGETWGLISDAGLPCIADPGSKLVELAHQHNVPVIAVVGPSSIILALQLSGFSGQQFAFHGYLPKDKDERIKKLLLLEKLSFGAAQLWIETPYRTSAMAEELVQVLKLKTRLCIASRLGSPVPFVVSKSVNEWKKGSAKVDNNPSIFLIYNDL